MKRARVSKREEEKEKVIKSKRVKDREGGKRVRIN